MFRRVLPVVIIVLGISSIAAARNCQQFFQRQVVVQQVVAHPQVYYGVGQDLQTEALAERVAALVEKKLAAKVVQSVEPRQSIEPRVPDPQPSAAMAAHCAKCHNGTNQKADLATGHARFDGLSDLKCSQITAALRAIAINKMPKDHAIDNLVKGQLMDELLNLEILPTRKVPDPVPVPPVPAEPAPVPAAPVPDKD